jgi:hypothetical protein
MYYINLKANSLATLVGRKKDGKIDWSAMGINADLINLNNIKMSKTSLDTNKIIYVLAIDNLASANIFKQDCFEKYGVEVSIIDEETAKELIELHSKV